MSTNLAHSRLPAHPQPPPEQCPVTGGRAGGPGLPSPSAAPSIRCREIGESDLPGLIDLLTGGFRVRSREFWMRAVERLRAHDTPAGFPRYGYLLEAGGAPVGAILLVFSSMVDRGERKIRCSVSSWYIRPEFRGYAAMLASRALRYKEITYFNITPHRDTWPILQAQGYARYCAGSFIAVPALSRRGARGARLKEVGLATCPDLPMWESELLRRHAGYGCISIVCSAAGRSHPFVLLPFRRYAFVRCAYLAYCRDVGDLVRFAGALGGYLTKRGILFLELDANGPVDGLFGAYFAGAPKYFKGPDRPRLGDIAYSERVLFGF